MNKILLISIITCSQFLLTNCKGQQGNGNKSNSDTNQRVGGPFENNELFYIGMPEKIAPSDSSAGWHQPGQKMLITGTIFKNDGKTPAPGVILYYYHTDINGLYASRTGLDKRVARHGYIRGWVQTDENGRYAIYTVRPGAYPGGTDPAHIHPAIKEPGINEYYIDEFVFDDDPLLTTAKRQQMQNRGGSGVLKLSSAGNIEAAEHNIVLGLNIPGYSAIR